MNYFLVLHLFYIFYQSCNIPTFKLYISFSNYKVIFKGFSDWKQTVEILGIKNKRIISLLEENIMLREKNSYIPVKIKNDEKTINNILRINGYYFSSVN